MKNQHHYFATCVFGFAKASTRDAAIQKLVSAFRVDIKRLVASDKKTGGTAAYLWSCRVDQADRKYAINNFAPQDVPMSESREHLVTKATLKMIKYIDLARGDKS